LGERPSSGLLRNIAVLRRSRPGGLVAVLGDDPSIGSELKPGAGYQERTPRSDG
jgi:hypothetical protein